MADMNKAMKGVKGARSTITLSILEKDKELVKVYALQNHITVSELLHNWIQEKCVPGAGSGDGDKQ